MMPFLEDDTAIDLSKRIDVPKGFAVTPGASDLEDTGNKPAWNWGAAFRRNNEMAALAASESAWTDNAPEPGFNPWEKIKGTADEANFAALSEARNQKKFDAIKADIARENADRKLLDSQPWWMGLLTEGSASVLSPTTLLPGGTFVKGAKGGFAIVRAGASVGVANAVSAGIQESALQSIEQTRTAAESGTAIGASLFLGGLLGAGGQAVLSKGEWQRGLAALEREAEAPSSPITPEAANANSPFRSVGAAAQEVPTIEENSIFGRAASGVAASTQRLNPLLRFLHSPSPVVREIALNTVENPTYLNRNFEVVDEAGNVIRSQSASPVSAESFIKEYNGGLAQAVAGGVEARAEHIKAGGQLDKAEFNAEAGKAMRRGDAHADPAVQKAAQLYRAKVFDPLFEQAKEVGIISKDADQTTAKSYFTRLWNSQKISADEQGFKGMLQEWVVGKLPGEVERFDKNAERRLNPIHSELNALEDAKLRRAEELKQRLDVADTSEMTEGDIRQALRIVQGGAPKPKGVKTLSQFVLEQGGLVDDAGELAHRGITNKARPGLIRKERRTAQVKGGWTLDDMARHAWENGYFPENSQRPSVDQFVEALNDDFHKIRAVLKHGDEDAFRLTELVAQLEADLARAGVGVDGKAPRFSTSEEMKGAVERVYKALDAEADRRIALLKDKLVEREADIRAERDARFLGSPEELAKQVAQDVFEKMTGRDGLGVNMDFAKVTLSGPLKERTLDIEDLFRASNGRAVEDFLEHDIEEVAKIYTRRMGGQVEVARKFGTVDMIDQFNAIKEDYQRLRNEVIANPDGKMKPEQISKRLKELKDLETRDVEDLEAMRDRLLGLEDQGPHWQQKWSKAIRMSNNYNYLTSMGEVVFASIAETVRPAMVHGLMPYMETVGQLATNMKGIRLSVKEAQLAGNVTERILGGRLAVLNEVMDPHSKRGPVDAFLSNMTNVASRWNGIRLLTDMQKSIASVISQNRILRAAEMYDKVAERDREFLAYVGIDQSMAERIAAQFAQHGETIDKVRVANTEKWTDNVARRHYRAAMNQDVDSIITTKGVADTPLLANTPFGRAAFQYKSFALASHQRVLLRGLQEPQARFVGGIIAMTTVGMMITWLKAQTGNRDEKLTNIATNPGQWISEGLDRSGIFSVFFEVANMAEKATGVNPIKSPIKAFDATGSISQKNQNRNLLGAVAGPTAGRIQDVGILGNAARKLAVGEELTASDKNAAERTVPLNSYFGMRQMLRYVINPPQQ